MVFESKYVLVVNINGQEEHSSIKRKGKQGAKEEKRKTSFWLRFGLAVACAAGETIIGNVYSSA
jgi:hypothetical protein